MNTQRLEQVKTLLAEKKVDALLVSNYFNILYLTGFKTLTKDEREGFVLITNHTVYVFTDARYEFNDKDVVLKLFEPQKGLTFYLDEIIKKENLKTIGFESEDLKYQEFFILKNRLAIIELVPLDHIFIQIRSVKDANEIAKVRGACHAGDQYLKQLQAELTYGMTEKEIAFRLEMMIRKNGDDLGFDPIVAIDTNAALPHYNTKTGSGILKEDSILLIDFGVKRDDYISDITRMFFGKKCESKIIETYLHLKDAQEKTLQQIPQVLTLNLLDQFCREELAKHTLPSYAHSTGHGVGLEIHENPKVYKTIPDEKKTGQVITIEPGVYEPGKFGMRVEDTVVITEKGYEILTQFSKELIRIQ